MAPMKRRTLLLLLSLFAIAALGCSKAHLKTLTVDQVAARIAAHDDKTFIYDANPKDVYESGHVPGAKWVKYDAVTAADLPGDHGAMLIFYCASPA